MQRFVQDIEGRGVSVSDVSVLHYDSNIVAHETDTQVTADEAVRRARKGGEDGLATGAGIGALAGLGLGALLVAAGPFALAPLLGIAAVGAGTGAISGVVAGMIGGAGSAVVDSIGHDDRVGNTTSADLILDERDRAAARQVIEEGGGVVALNEGALPDPDLLNVVTAHGGRLI